MLLNEDFLLTTEWARTLFHSHAEHMPIIDYHCHLDPQQIYLDKRFDNLTQVWLNDNGSGDHYKWRLLRANGADEKFITGNEDDKLKYLEFVKAIEKAPGNPLFDWSHLELRRVFNIDLTINQSNAEKIWELANTEIAKPWFSACGLIKKFNVQCICTTDDPISELKYHKLLADREKINGFKVLPTFRPDMLLAIGLEGFKKYIEKLSLVSNIKVIDLETLKEAIAQRVDYFHIIGGRLADQGMNYFHFYSASAKEVESIFKNKLDGAVLDENEVGKYQSYITLYLMNLYYQHGWTMQIHMNCFRNDSTIGFVSVGRDSGFDSVGDQPDIVKQIRILLDASQQHGTLPKIILYSLNSSDWMGLASLAGSFEGGCCQRVHFGCAWWFNDTLSGIRQQLITYAEQSLLGNFVGMLTDSRSFLSYPRHEYFRRILCSVLGEWVMQGRLPEDSNYLGKLVEDISYYNAKDYFNFPRTGIL
jgi:glucuronate isomerase